MQYKLPDGFQCEHCVLQWWWLTESTFCIPCCSSSVAENGTHPNSLLNSIKFTLDNAWDGGPNLTPNGAVFTGWPEEFYNCADIKIGAPGTGPTPTPTTAAPSTQAPSTTKAPTTAAPSTQAPPTTKAPTTKAPTTKAPTNKPTTTKPTSTPCNLDGKSFCGDGVRHSDVLFILAHCNFTLIPNAIIDRVECASRTVHSCLLLHQGPYDDEGAHYSQALYYTRPNHCQADNHHGSGSPVQGRVGQQLQRCAKRLLRRLGVREPGMGHSVLRSRSQLYLQDGGRKVQHGR